jgi:hypothetical protein
LAGYLQHPVHSCRAQFIGIHEQEGNGSSATFAGNRSMFEAPVERKKKSFL